MKDSSLWRSNFIPSVHDSIIIIGSRFCYFVLLVRVLFINIASRFVTPLVRVLIINVGSGFTIKSEF
jgi:hypothetical protein